MAHDPLADLADSEIVARLRNRGIDEAEARRLVADREDPESLSTLVLILGYTVDDITM